MVLELVPVESIISLVQQHGVLAVVMGMIVEEIIVPIPSPVIPMAAGALLVESVSIPAAAIEIFLFIALPASIASVISSYFVYLIAYFGGEPVIRRYGRYLDISWEEVQQLEEHFDSGREKYYVALFRAVPVVPLSLISGSAGLFQMEWREYGIWSFIGMLPRNFGLAFIGWYFGEKIIVTLANRINTVEKAVVVLVVGTVGSVILYRKAKDFYRWLIDRT